MKKLFFLPILIFLNSCNDNNSNASKILLGHKVYDSVCISCHNQGPGPNLFENNLSKKEIIYVVNFGQGQMSGLINDLTENEIEAVAYYIIKNKK